MYHLGQKSCPIIVAARYVTPESHTTFYNHCTVCVFSGLVLQDLTFVHIGNSDLLPDGTINFSKRWQQFNIVENMKRFKKA